MATIKDIEDPIYSYGYTDHSTYEVNGGEYVSGGYTLTDVNVYIDENNSYYWDNETMNMRSEVSIPNSEENEYNKIVNLTDIYYDDQYILNSIIGVKHERYYLDDNVWAFTALVYINPNKKYDKKTGTDVSNSDYDNQEGTPFYPIKVYCKNSDNTYNFYLKNVVGVKNKNLETNNEKDPKYYYNAYDYLGDKDKITNILVYKEEVDRITKLPSDYNGFVAFTNMYGGEYTADYVYVSAAFNSGNGLQHELKAYTENDVINSCILEEESDTHITISFNGQDVRRIINDRIYTVRKIK